MTAAEGTPPRAPEDRRVCARPVGRAAPAELGVQPGRAGARWLRGRRDLLGRVQHRAGDHQYGEVLHRLSRDARQRVRGAEIDDPFLQPLGRARDLPGLSRSAQLDATRSRARCRPRRKSGAHLFGTIDTREKFQEHRLELALHEWARLKANDSLECRNCHSAESMDITKQSPRAVRRASAPAVHRPEDLHRLPQGHRAQAARHARRAWLAIDGKAA